MYCLRCYYDLRGQIAPYCPECGASFDHGDTGTFLGRFPSPIRRLKLWARQHRTIIYVMALIGVAATLWYTAPDLPLSNRRVHPSVVSALNMKDILTSWLIRKDDADSPTKFDKKHIEDEVHRGFSAIHEYRMGRIKTGIKIWYRSQFVFLHLGAILVVLMIAAVLQQGQSRMLASWAAVIVGLAILDPILGGPLLDRALPGSAKYLDDYVYLPAMDEMGLGRTTGSKVVAYELVPSFHRRIVGWDDGHAESLPDSKLIPLLANQGEQLAPDVVPTSQP